jgi:hypothetical protein
MKYKSDPVFKAKSDVLLANDVSVAAELQNPNGFTFEDNDGSLEKAANEWNTMGLWSVGMTASKTQVINSKMIKVAQDGMKLGSDPVYGPFIEKQQQILAEDVEDAFQKYENT